MSSSPTPSATGVTTRSKKLLVPKVWKRPHSTIYGKNVEFGTALYSDKIGELNGRKFNSELPWSMRNSGGGSGTGASSPGIYNQGYLSTLETTNNHNLSFGEPMANQHGSSMSYEHLLEMTNPNRFSSKRGEQDKFKSGSSSNKRIDFYDQYGDFSKEIDHLNQSSLLMNEPLLTRRVFDNLLDFDYELGLFVPTTSSGGASGDRWNGLGASNSGSRVDRCSLLNANCNNNKSKDINPKPFNPYIATTQQNLQLLPRHQCHLMSSPYGQSADGRKLSLGSINPQSYRPSLPQKTTTAHSSDGEEFEFHDRSSPFYTDRWAGKTIRHFDSDLYSNANLFKSMIL